MDDEPNMADAILLALHHAGWIGPLVRKGSVKRPAPAACATRGCHAPIHGLGMCASHYQKWWRSTHPREKRVRVRGEQPQHIRRPPGVVWGRACFLCRIRVGNQLIHIGSCGDDQAAVDALGRQWEAMRQMRQAGADAATITAALGRKEAA